jgi:hypothetical protein
MIAEDRLARGRITLEGIIAIGIFGWIVLSFTLMGLDIW